MTTITDVRAATTKELLERRAQLDGQISNLETWVNKLRAGGYQQGRERLKQLALDEDGDVTEVAEYCCLGVACEVLDREHFVEVGGTWIHEGPNYDNDSYPQQNVSDMLGLDKDTMKALAELNDLEDGGFTFERIAAVIMAFVRAPKARERAEITSEIGRRARVGTGAA